MGKKKKNYQLAEKDYIARMKYKDIAKKYGVSINTVKSWKQRYEWNRDGVHTNSKNSVHTNSKNSVHTKDSAKEEVKALMKNEELTDKQKLFCIYYTKYFNATKAYQKAYGCNYNTAMVEGSKHLRKPKLKEQIQRLKENKLKGAFLEEGDILQKYIDIAFADITDYVEFGHEERVIGFTAEGAPLEMETNYIDLKNSNEIDGTLIAEVKTSRQGASIKLQDRQKALDWLTKFFEMNPEHQYKKEYDKKKLQLERERFEHQKEMDKRDAW